MTPQQQQNTGSNGMRIAYLICILACFVATACLGLTAHKREPNADDTPNDCSGVSCWEPPSNSCADDNVLEVYAPSGYCSGGECSYGNRQEPCHTGLCRGGVCTSTPCQGMTCIDPPAAFCTDGNRTIYAPSGYCSGGVCEYASQTSSCDYSCDAGTCSDSPCAEVFCHLQPAPYCQNDKNLVVFEPEGRCTVEKERPKCLHDSQTIPCAHGCKGGRCQDSPCAGVTCNRPPARFCDGTVLVLFEPFGVCDETGFCNYAEHRHPCIEPCVDARCGEDDACTWVTCDRPPATHCASETHLRAYDQDGWCQDGFCSYVYSDIKCNDGCLEGRCIEDPCKAAYCDDPPPNFCLEGNLVTWDVSSGTCENGVCTYQEVPQLCPGTDCADGRCGDDLCAGIECSSHLAPYCLSDSVLIDYPDTGSCNPASGYCVHEAQESTCAVRCEDGRCLDAIDESAKEIEKFSILGIDGAIGANTITLTLPAETELTSLTPTIRHTGASISPLSGTPTDFTNPVPYTVTALDKSTRVYSVAVSVANWTSKSLNNYLTNPNWIKDIAVSADGNTIILNGVNHADIFLRGHIFSFTNHNNNWKRHDGAGYRTWQSVAASDDVARIVALAVWSNPVSSADRGNTWIEHWSAGAKLWTELAGSRDGIKLAAAVENDSIFTSTDGGKTWTKRGSSGAREWRGLSSSADGTKLAAVAPGNPVRTSEDGGATWTDQTDSGSRDWYDIASSADGTKLIAAAFREGIYTSADSGVTWSQRATVPSMHWSAVASSADGTKLVATASSGYIYISTDSGATWTENIEAGQRDWRKVACSDDCSTIAAAAYQTKILYIAR